MKIWNKICTIVNNHSISFPLIPSHFGHIQFGNNEVVFIHWEDGRKYFTDLNLNISELLEVSMRAILNALRSQLCNVFTKDIIDHSLLTPIVTYQDFENTLDEIEAMYTKQMLKHDN